MYVCMYACWPERLISVRDRSQAQPTHACIIIVSPLCCCLILMV